MNVDYEKAKIKIFAWSIEDWIDLFFFSGIIDEYFHYKDLDSLKKATFDFMRDVLEKDLMKAGELLPKNTFAPWDMTIDKIIETIKFKWDNLGRDLHPQEIVWFDITEKGKKEFEYLDSLPELASIPIPYLKVFNGEKKEAEEWFLKLIIDTKIVRVDKLKKIKIYKFLDGSYLSNREVSKYNTSIFEIHYVSEKNELYKLFDKSR
jgi:hypothetical protein